MRRSTLGRRSFRRIGFKRIGYCHHIPQEGRLQRDSRDLCRTLLIAPRPDSVTSGGEVNLSLDRPCGRSESGAHRLLAARTAWHQMPRTRSSDGQPTSRPGRGHPAMSTSTGKRSTRSRAHGCLHVQLRANRARSGRARDGTATDARRGWAGVARGWHPVDLPEGDHTATRGRAARGWRRYHRGLPPRSPRGRATPRPRDAATQAPACTSSVVSRCAESRVDQVGCGVGPARAGRTANQGGAKPSRTNARTSSPAAGPGQGRTPPPAS